MTVLFVDMLIIPNAEDTIFNVRKKNHYLIFQHTHT